ncbi:MAG: hypothetical protein COZ21_09600 [Bacteroidetes bacterium CG_4_10_14_3_um_filter_31_20]|nr:MAG: hypothetical protein COZ21_09600 [Bacteroidetes bacterium CG_4_10_14_3_um_filter_31_20]
MTLVSCADSRVPANAIMPDTINKIFKIENIGNQVLSCEGSVDYGVLHLKTPVLMILGHSDCGAIKAYLKGFNEETYNIKRELDFLLPIINKTANELNFEKQLSTTIQHNIDYQVNIAYKKYRDIVKNKKLTIIGAYYDFKNEFNKGFGRIIITNVNKNKEQILDLSEFNEVRNNVNEIYVGRLIE